MDNFDNLSASEKAEAAELQRMIAVEQQKAQFQAQVRMLTVLAYQHSSVASGVRRIWVYQAPKIKNWILLSKNIIAVMPEK